jgi:hypothetical protein
LRGSPFEFDRFVNLAPAPAPQSPTAKSKAAIVRALDWLAKRQRDDGFWSLKDNGADNENLEGATALAMLALVREGHWRSGSAHNSAVVKGWRALIGSQQMNGQFSTKAPTAHHPYTHAIATIVACELYAKTRGPNYQASAQMGLKFCADSQSDSGGWRYEPKKDGDLSVTGWFVQAIQAGQRAGLNLAEKERITSRLSKFLDTVQANEGRYRYHATNPIQDASLAMTASGLHARLRSGWKLNDPRIVKRVEYLTSNLPGPATMDNYYWLYGSMVMAESEEPFRSTWFDALRDAILSSQDPDSGSWNPAPQKWGAAGGRLAITCFNIYSLQLDVQANQE